MSAALYLTAVLLTVVAGYCVLRAMQPVARDLRTVPPYLRTDVRFAPRRRTRSRVNGSPRVLRFDQQAVRHGR